MGLMDPEGDLPADILPAGAKSKRSPLVIVGALATAGVLTAGLISFRDGQAGRSQALMRARVGLQAATVALMVATGGLEVLRNTDDVFGTVRRGLTRPTPSPSARPSPRPR